MGLVSFQENSFDQALVHLSRAAQAEPRLPDLHLRLGNTYMRMHRLEEAEQSFQRALSIDGDSPVVHLGLAHLRLRRRQNREAAEEALAAVGLQHFLPMGHYCLGVALSRLGHLERAELAFRTALTMAPDLNAHRWLIAIYRSQGTNFDKVANHRRAIRELQQTENRQLPPKLLGAASDSLKLIILHLALSSKHGGLEVPVASAGGVQVKNCDYTHYPDYW